MYYTQEQIDRANQADLVSFLQGRGEQLTRAGQEYRWKRHDSLTVRGNKWYRHSQSKGGAPIDFVCINVQESEERESTDQERKNWLSDLAKIRREYG